MVAANYLAAIGAVDTGVLILEDWIKQFKYSHQDWAPEYGPQLEWYLLRAKLSVGNLPYQYGGLAVPHRGLVSWQADESGQLGRLIKVADAEGWKRLCSGIAAPTLHRNIGHWLAYIYATERFYLFENLTPLDFDPNDNRAVGSLLDNIHNAEMLRDNHACLGTVSPYVKDQQNYESYFNLYTAQLHLIQLSGERNTDRRNGMIEIIGRELDEADRFGPPGKTFSLLPVDTWERHRVRVRLLKGQLQDEKNGR